MALVHVSRRRCLLRRLNRSCKWCRKLESRENDQIRSTHLLFFLTIVCYSFICFKMLIVRLLLCTPAFIGEPQSKGLKRKYIFFAYSFSSLFFSAPRKFANIRRCRCLTTENDQMQNTNLHFFMTLPPLCCCVLGIYLKSLKCEVAKFTFGVRRSTTKETTCTRTKVTVEP
jgi:hypothetical protein